MNFIRLSVNNPIAIFAVVFIAVLFGWLALQSIPIQLTPDLNKPVISVRTNWGGASPQEIEREIIIRQEEELKGIQGLEEIDASIREGRGTIDLTFSLGQNMPEALLLVANRLDGIINYPDESGQPQLKVSSSEDNAIAWFRLLRTNDNLTPIYNYGDLVEDVVADRLERVKGIGQTNYFGGRNREIQVIVKPDQLSLHGLTVSDVLVRLRQENVAVSAGYLDEGKRRYIVRFDNEFNALDKIKSVIVTSGQKNSNSSLGHVRIEDIAEVQFGYSKSGASIRSMGIDALAINVTREQGANVIDTMAGVRQAVAELNEGILASENLKLHQIYDETIYINSAIDLVLQNIWIGGLAAFIILLLFLRSLRATLVIAISIPISVIASFVVMAAFGRSLNVISLAGIAFAVGMVVDAAIVVLENIYRLSKEDRPIKESAILGASQVWGAVLVSALTTVMVFIPILLIDLEVGQLFRDIAVAISVSVMLSLLVSVSVIPTLSVWLLDKGKGQSGGEYDTPEKQLRLPGIDFFAQSFSKTAYGIAQIFTRHKLLALATVIVLIPSAFLVSWYFLPKLEYLPKGNRNLVFGVVFPPPGYNLNAMQEMALRVEAHVKPYWEQNIKDKPEKPKVDTIPAINNFFFVATTSRTFVGASSVDPTRAAELKPLLKESLTNEPGTFAFFSQASLFGRGVGGGRAISLDITGGNLEDIVGVAQQAFGKVSEALPFKEGNQVRPRPSLDLGSPEVRLTPIESKLFDAGLTARDLATSIDSFNDGVRALEVTLNGTRINLIVKGPNNYTQATQDIGDLPVVTRNGTIVPVSHLAQIDITSGPTQIRHTERRRSITLQISPRDDVALEDAINIIRTQVVQPLEEQGLPEGVRLSLSGTADKLTKTWEAMKVQLALAMVIVYFVMSVLFRSLIFPLIIAVSVPTAMAGGVLGLYVLNQFVFNPLDMLTLLGFVILIGIVVNNAILLVYQTLAYIREDKMEYRQAIVEATRNRIRPIFMSTLTSIVGMLPLVVFPGAGAEIYRGLGAVVVGGLSLSSFLTLIFVPALLSLTLSMTERKRNYAK